MGGVRLVLADQLAHFFYFPDIRGDCTDAYDVVGLVFDFIDEGMQRREIKQSRGGVQIALNQHKSERTVEHSQGKCTLCTRHLVLIELHGVYIPAAILVILRIWAENAGQQYFGF